MSINLTEKEYVEATLKRIDAAFKTIGGAGWSDAFCTCPTGEKVCDYCVRWSALTAARRCITKRWYHE